MCLILYVSLTMILLFHVAVCLYKNLLRRHNFRKLGLDIHLWDDRLWCSGGTWYNEKQDGKLLFEPPVYQQRYSAIANIIEQIPFHRKIVEFGCAELKLFPILKRVDGIERVIHVDLDQELVERCMDKVRPLASDYLIMRTSPLNVQVHCGNAALYDECLAQADVVVAIELIEHLYFDTLLGVTKNIFENISPGTVIITTPNAEFNILFTDLVGMRHYDHKFEWTRQQFQRWALEIIKEYTDYNVKLYGVGPGPEGTEHLGCCSQMAIFTKTQNNCAESIHKTDNDKTYRLICEHDFPVYIDTRTTSQRLSDELRFRMSTVRQFTTVDPYALEIPIKEFMMYLHAICPSITQVSSMLKEEGWEIKKGEDGPCVVIPESEHSDSETENWSNVSDDHFEGEERNVTEDWAAGTGDWANMTANSDWSNDTTNSHDSPNVTANSHNNWSNITAYSHDSSIKVANLNDYLSMSMNSQDWSDVSTKSCDWSDVPASFSKEDRYATPAPDGLK